MWLFYIYYATFDVYQTGWPQGRLHHHMENHPWLVRGKTKNQKIPCQSQQKRWHPTNEIQRPTAELKGILSSLLGNGSGEPLSDLPPPAAQNQPIDTNPPKREETPLAIRQMKKIKAAGLDSAITAEALQNGGDAMTEIVHDFCKEVFSTLIPPSQWTTSIIVPLLEKENLSLMTNYRGISLLPITANVYNKNQVKQDSRPCRPHLKKHSGWISLWK